MIPRILWMLNRLAVESHTLPVHQGYSLDIFHLKGCWGLRSLHKRQNEEPPNVWDTSDISGNVFAHPQTSSSAPYPQELNSTWKKNYRGNQSTCLLQRKVEDQSETQIWDASPDRQPKIQSSSVEKTLQRIMEQTNNDCRFRIFILINSLHQLRLLAGR